MDEITIPKTVFDNILNTLKHAEVFIRTREKMHPDGVYLYNDLISSLKKVASQSCVAADAESRCEFCGEINCKDAECEDDY